MFRVGAARKLRNVDVSGLVKVCAGRAIGSAPGMAQASKTMDDPNR